MERQRLEASAERARSQYEDHLTHLQIQHAVDLEKLQGSLRESAGRDLLAVREGHALAMGAALADAAALHRYQILQLKYFTHCCNYIVRCTIFHLSLSYCSVSFEGPQF